MGGLRDCGGGKPVLQSNASKKDIGSLDRGGWWGIQGSTGSRDPRGANDGFLTASEISGMSLSAKWVILIAYNYGEGDAQKALRQGPADSLRSPASTPMSGSATSRKPTADIVGGVTTDGRCWREADLSQAIPSEGAFPCKYERKNCRTWNTPDKTNLY